MSELRVEEDDLDYDDNLFRLWQDSKFTGTGVARYRSGAIKREVEYRDGVREGVARSWHENGQLHYICMISKGSPHGTKTEWHLDGRLKAIEKFEHGIVVEARRSSPRTPS